MLPELPHKRLLFYGLSHLIRSVSVCVLSGTDVCPPAWGGLQLCTVAGNQGQAAQPLADTFSFKYIKWTLANGAVFLL